MRRAATFIRSTSCSRRRISSCARSALAVAGRPPLAPRALPLAPRFKLPPLGSATPGASAFAFASVKRMSTGFDLTAARMARVAVCSALRLSSSRRRLWNSRHTRCSARAAMSCFVSSSMTPPTRIIACARAFIERLRAS